VYAGEEEAASESAGVEALFKSAGHLVRGLPGEWGGAGPDGTH
jgi:hypothetical protein